MHQTLSANRSGTMLDVCSTTCSSSVWTVSVQREAKVAGVVLFDMTGG